MTIKKILEGNTKTIDYLDLLNIVSFVLKKNNASILANLDNHISKHNTNRISKMIKLREKNYPLAYLFNYQYFYHLKLKVNKDVLIPRPSTEKILELIENNDIGRSKQNFVDIGCGSGAIIVALADLLRKYRIFSYYGLDISSKALKVAKYNALQYHLNIKFSKSDLLNNLKLKNSNRTIFIANLPYLNSHDLKEKSILFEPKLALYAPENGFALYRRLIKQLLNYHNFKAYLEIKPEQEIKVRECVKNDFQLSFSDDLSKKIKIAILER